MNRMTDTRLPLKYVMLFGTAVHFISCAILVDWEYGGNCQILWTFVPN